MIPVTCASNPRRNFSFCWGMMHTFIASIENLTKSSELLELFRYQYRKMLLILLKKLGSVSVSTSACAPDTMVSKLLLVLHTWNHFFFAALKQYRLCCAAYWQLLFLSAMKRNAETQQSKQDVCIKQYFTLKNQRRRVRNCFLCPGILVLANLHIKVLESKLQSGGKKWYRNISAPHTNSIND